MNLMKWQFPQMPKVDFSTFQSARKDYSFLFRLDPNVTYSQGYSYCIRLGGSTISSMNPFGLTEFRIISQNLQMGSFRLKEWNASSILMESMTKDGRKVPKSCLPWERNNFKGAFGTEVSKRIIRN